MKHISRILIAAICLIVILSGCSNQSEKQDKVINEEKVAVNSEKQIKAEKKVSEEETLKTEKPEKGHKTINLKTKQEKKRNPEKEINEVVSPDKEPEDKTTVNKETEPVIQEDTKPEDNKDSKPVPKPEKKKVWVVDREAYYEVIDDKTKPIYEYRETWLIYFRDGSVKTYYNKQEWKNAIYANKKNISSYADGEDEEVLAGYEKKTIHHKEEGHWEWK